MNLFAKAEESKNVFMRPVFKYCRREFYPFGNESEAGSLPRGAARFALCNWSYLGDRASMSDNKKDLALFNTR